VEDQNKVACTVGIIAHNEAANIGRIIKAVCEQALETVDIAEIVVVASGCTDGTERIAAEWAEQDGRIQVLVQEKREGKASGINFFLRHASHKVVVLSSADLLPEQTAVEALVAPFADPEMGMTSCRPVPLNDNESFMGFAAHLLWDLHHQINLNGFKAGEVTAFRKIFERIPYHTAVDEASVEPVIRGQGYQVKYVPEAVVYNKGPETVEDFLRQRRRIYAGHLAVRQALGYAVSTMNGRKILGLLIKNLDWRPKQLFWTGRVVLLEVYGRFLGWRDFKTKKDHSVWEIAQTTKELKVN
jgi:cellulose synthase/poly-beta-1,6-N-acetylglucosamine synthase-like glycosyltransferase